MLDFHKNHNHLVLTAFIGFTVLSIIIAILPAMQMQDVEPLPSQARLNEEELKGLKVYISEGCVGCHTQQVRNIAMDEVWGERPSLPSDYYYSKQRLDFWRQSPSLLGSERTGPDLTNIGNRQPGQAWHLLHLYNPRSVIQESIMPAYPWLFEEKYDYEITEEDIIIPLDQQFFYKKGKKVVAGKKALQLTAYLQSLKQHEIADQNQADFIPSSKKQERASSQATNGPILPDGEKLYKQHCAVCHQANGQGVKGAFPPLAESPVVNDPNSELMIKIILLGYDARSEYGQMPGFASRLSDEQITAIINHERKSWGNEGVPVFVEDVKKIRDLISQTQ